MRRAATLFLILLWSTSCAFSQSKKKLRTYGIAQKTESIVKYDKGIGGEIYVSEIEKYNEDGEWIERVDYQTDGDIKRHEVRKFEKGMVVEEIDNKPQDKEWLEKTPKYDRHVYIYDKEDLLEKHELNQQGEIKEKKIYVYNKYGDVVTETTKSDNGEIKGIVYYTYDSKGLKKEKKTVNEKEELQEIKTYTYE